MSGERVCMLVRNDCRTDYRVLKEAARSRVPATR